MNWETLLMYLQQAQPNFLLTHDINGGVPNLNERWYEESLMSVVELSTGFKCFHGLSVWMTRRACVTSIVVGLVATLFSASAVTRSLSGSPPLWCKSVIQRVLFKVQDQSKGCFAAVDEHI